MPSIWHAAITWDLIVRSKCSVDCKFRVELRKFTDSYAVRRQRYTAITGGVLGIASPLPVRVYVVPPMLVPSTVPVLKIS